MEQMTHDLGGPVKTIEWPEAHGTSPSILVVEDEDDVRQSALLVLNQLGYRAFEARDSAEALRLLDERQDIDLLLTDVRMPGDMDGVELAFTVHSRWPRIAIIVVSGVLDLKGSRLPCGASFLAKPYGFPELRTMIDRQLARSPGRQAR
jgi:CheY-like chemotaxis protein